MGDLCGIISVRLAPKLKQGRRMRRLHLRRSASRSCAPGPEVSGRCARDVGAQGETEADGGDPRRGLEEENSEDEAPDSAPVSTLR